MIVSNLTLRNFRNYEYLQVSFTPKINLIIGENAQGKTNIVEAIHFLSIARSFRGAENAELIQNKRQFATIEARVVEDTINKDIVAILTPTTKKVSCNGSQIKKISDLSKLVNVIVFEPKETLMFSDSPLRRRNFLDVSISKQSQSYLENLMMFERLLKERNAILKNESIDKIQLDVVTTQMIKVQKVLCEERRNYVNQINDVLSKIITSLKGEDQTAELLYQPFVQLDDEFENNCARAYERILESDIKHKATQIGIHREDFSMILNGKDISLQGSQGENRISVIALKLSPYFLIEDKERRPIIVLDDVMSELDKEHQLRLMKFLEKLGQVFITSTNTKFSNASIYEVKNQKIYRRK